MMLGIGTPNSQSKIPRPISSFMIYERSTLARSGSSACLTHGPSFYDQTAFAFVSARGSSVKDLVSSHQAGNGRQPIEETPFPPNGGSRNNKQRTLLSH